MNSICFSEISKSIGTDCDHPLLGGFTGRAVLVKYADNPTLSIDSDNPRILEDVTLATGKKPIAISNIMTNPFSGSATAGNSDSGRVMFSKSFSIRIPLRGAASSEAIVEALANSEQGYLVIAEKKDKVGDGSFEVFGLQNPMRVVDPSTITRNEGENGGDVLMTLATEESWFECTLFDTNYATTKSAFDTLYNSAE